MANVNIFVIVTMIIIVQTKYSFPTFHFLTKWMINNLGKVIMDLSKISLSVLIRLRAPNRLSSRQICPLLSRVKLVHTWSGTYLSPTKISPLHRQWSMHKRSSIFIVGPGRPRGLSMRRLYLSTSGQGLGCGRSPANGIDI